jgi:methionyl-tRNA formyltransferase
MRSLPLPISFNTSISDLIMRFAITTIDRYLGVFKALVSAGWAPLKLFTQQVSGPLESNDAVIAFAERHHAAVQISRLTQRDLQLLAEQGCEALVVAGYSWRIPDWRPFLKYAVNFHASPLPEARGPYPAVRAILENRDSWGVTCHQLSPEFDRADILASETFPLHPDECHESLDLKVQMAAQRLATAVSGQFLELWTHAESQAEGSYWPHGINESRVIDFAWSVDQIMRNVRAHGLLETHARVNNKQLSVRRAVGWTEAHGHKPGDVVHRSNRKVVVAARDGYIGLVEWSFADETLVSVPARGNKTKAVSCR